MLAGRMLLESVEHSRQWICSGRPNFSLGLFIFSASMAPSGCMGWSCWWRLLASYFLRSFLYGVLITSHGLPQIFVLIEGGLRCREYSWEQGRELGRHRGEDGGQGLRRRNTDEIKWDGAQRPKKLRRGQKLKKSKWKEKRLQREFSAILGRVYSIQCLIWSCQAHWGK